MKARERFVMPTLGAAEAVRRRAQGAGKHGDRRLKRKRTRQAVKDAALREQ